MCFDVVRARDGVVLATYDNFDMAMSYAHIAANVMRMGDCNVVARQQGEEE